MATGKSSIPRSLAVLIESDVHFQEELDKHKLNGTPYKRAPIAKEMTTLTLDNKNLYRHWMNTDTSKIEAEFDKKYRQAALNITEDRIEVIRRVRLWGWMMGQRFNRDDTDRPYTEEMINSIIKNLEHRGKENFALEARGRRIKSARLVNPDRVRNALSEGRGRNIREVYIEVTATFPNRETNLLIGFDEVAQFISMLPERAKSVEHAHKILKPKGIGPKTDAKRQGEWFFIPASKTAIKQIEAKVKRNPRSVVHGPINGSSHWRSTTTHRGTYVNLDGTRYAIGIITDSRKGRHEPLILSGWHKVIRNNEIQPRGTTATQRTRYWD